MKRQVGRTRLPREESRLKEDEKKRRGQLRLETKRREVEGRRKRTSSGKDLPERSDGLLQRDELSLDTSENLRVENERKE